MPNIVWVKVPVPPLKAGQIIEQWRRGRYLILHLSKALGGHYTAIAELDGDHVVVVGTSKSLDLLKQKCQAHHTQRNRGGNYEM